MDDQSGSSSFRALFESVLQLYEKETGITLDEHPLAVELQNCRSADTIIALLQNQIRVPYDFGGNNRIVTSIESTVSILSTLSATTAFAWATGLTISPENAIHAGLAILLAIAKDIETDDDALADLLESIERFIGHINVYTQVPHTRNVDEMVVRIVLELLSTLALATKRLTQGRLTRFVLNHFGEEDVGEVLQGLDRHTPDEAQAIAAEALKVVHVLVQNMNVAMGDGKPSIGGVRAALGILHQMASNKNRPRRDELQRDIQNWLSPPDPWKNHRTACELHHEGTATWFIEGEMFSEWKASGRNSLLWIHGKPGAGKSVLCSTIIQEIEAMRRSGLASLAFYYHDFGDDQKNDLRGLLSSMLFQLCNQSESYHNIISTFYSTDRSPSDDELARCLKELLELPGQAPVYVVVDALDECRNTPALSSPREKVLMLVEDLINSKLPNLRVCVTSRPEADIKVVLQPLAFHSVSIHDEIGQLEDIEKFISWTVNTNRKMRRWKPEDRQLVMNVLTSRADGMFRWVYCQLEYLNDCIPGRIRRALDELPETLDGTYERTLREIKSTNWEFTQRLFQCVAAASRPLRSEELAEFLAFDFNAGPIPTFHEEWRLEDPLEAVLSTCSTLLVLINVDDSPVIQFSHFSVKGFLTSTRFAEKRDTISCRYYVSMVPAHTLVAQACLGILLHLDGNVTEDILKKFPLAEYPAEHWVVHARFEGVSENAEEGLKHLFDPSKRHLAVWLWIHNPGLPTGQYHRAVKPLLPRGSPLHYAAFCGLQSIVTFLAIKQPRDVRSRDFHDDWTPLHVASSRGHAEVACFLIDYGAKTNAKARYGQTPLRLAVWGGREEAARLLLEHDANPNPKDDYTETPLHWVIRSRRDDLARLLLEYGANVAAKDVAGRTPLYCAMWYGRGDLASLLIEHGADVTAREKDGPTLLHQVVRWEREDFARLLLEHGADVTAEDKDGSTPLHWAVQNRTEDLTRLLLERGADATAKDKDGSTLLHLVLVQDRREDLARLLVGHGADVTAKNKDGSTLLHLAVQNGRVGPTRLFLEHGADATTKDMYGLTPLHWAVLLRREDLTRLLVEHGADTMAKDTYGLTPLRWAVLLRSEDLARLLGEQGVDSTAKENDRLHLMARGRGLLARSLGQRADTTAKNKDGSTLLHWAVQNGREDITHLLLEHGADATAKTKDGPTLLHLTVQNGREDLMRLLLEHGVDTTAKNKGGMTALYLAVRKEREDLARLLVEHGVDLTTKNKDGSTPLHLAVRYGRENLARFFIEHGADVTAKDKDGWAPLHFAAMVESVDLARLLVEHGANTRVKDKEGSTPLRLAVEAGRVDLARFLIEHGADPAAKNNDKSSLLHLATENGREDLIRLLLEHGVDVVAKDKCRRTPLHLAVQNGREDLIRLLVEHGADSTAKDMYGSTPSHLAVERGREDLARACSSNMVADVTGQDNHGSTQLHTRTEAQYRHGRLRRIGHRFLEA